MIRITWTVNQYPPPGDGSGRCRAHIRGSKMAASLRDDLASLKINRDRDRDRRPSSKSDHAPAEWGGGRVRGGGEGGIRVVSMLLWLIPLGLLGLAGTYGYRQYDQIRAKPEVNV